ncbi:efflux RND transporter periplasmic adaptor subunit [Aminipila luticellarii]|uniref:Efflux RND transporter periplasmic adaptor subunit n=1 Tax=Aminipila luticellarii TaxID=2507160 RepID=A0A410PYD1_9FIRM|nr:efflux RND transporter periplasmic adaptor subunit [Aminipila luticellarii]QAT43850.1 efflux RND transporter periplasmic adaptor subunit [Aminipila luticellarii]
MKGILKGKMKIIIIAVIILVIAAVAIPKILAARQSDYAEAAPPTVELANPATGNIELKSSLIGTVEPSNFEEIYPKISGEVTSVRVKAGQRVSAGQVICTIDNKMLNTASIGVQSAQVTLSDARTAMDRAEALYASGDISTQNYEAAQNALAKAQLAYESAANDYSNQSGYSTVTASISGLVESCDIDVYDNVGPQTKLCVISGGTDKVVSFDATERITRNMKVGDKLTVEKGGTKYEGTISEISTMVDQTSGLFKVKALIGSNAALATGTSATVNVITDKVQNVMTIPADAVYYEDGKALVYTYEKGKAHKVFIEVGISDDKNIEVISGLSSSDKVIATWSSELYEGAAVNGVN